MILNIIHQVSISSSVIIMIGVQVHTADTVNGSIYIHSHDSLNKFRNMQGVSIQPAMRSKLQRRVSLAQHENAI
jgi:hypothetical protein